MNPPFTLGVYPDKKQTKVLSGWAIMYIGGGLSLSSQTVGSLLRPPWPVQDGKMI